YRCKTCLDPSPRCKHCTVSSHRQSPTHHISKWNGDFWVESSLAELDLVLHLGHPGRPPISASACDDSNPIYSLVVGDLHGFSNVKFTFCSHGKSTRATQLLAAGIMPCTNDQPQSAFTLSMLNHLSVFTTTGKCSGYKYWSVIKRLTKTGFPGQVSNRYRELLQTLRKYNYLIHRKRSGVAYSAHPIEVDPADQALSCVACPRPGYNFQLSEIKNEIELAFFRFFASLDGNFRNPRKAKKVDEDDICLTDGLFYFPKWEEYMAYVKCKHCEPPDRDKAPRECDNHKAARDIYVRFLGVDVSGVGAVTCARHSCFMPRGMVDFFRGER
ncbi:hypothetical protein BDV93DRAFT_416776, partial [Ceratobasidium sp. AG-I]